MARRTKKQDLDPDEIFLDSSNLPSFDEDQFEGRLEKPISKSSILIASSFFIFVALVFVARIWDLQIIRGVALRERSNTNSLKHIPVATDRGIIFDRNGEKLAWNEPDGRKYTGFQGLAHVLGYLGYPTESEIESSGFTNPKDMIGKDGVEKKWDTWLRGKDGTRIVEVDAVGDVISESIFEPGIKGGDITLSVDAKISNKMAETIRGLSAEKGFAGGAGVIMDARSGEILAFASYPEYDGTILSAGKETKKILGMFNDARKPFLNRIVSGLYIPGSVIKPTFALGALNEKIISWQKEIVSTGSISVPNPNFPDKPSVFKDWKAHGAVNMKKALAVSSDVYFYTIGGGYGGQKGLGIANLDKYARLFGYGEKTGIDIGNEEIGNIPTPEWKAENFNGENWTIGNTYHSVIGQYGFQVTPLQVVRAIAGVASEGRLVQPTILKISVNSNTPEGGSESLRKYIDIPNEYFKIVKEGMRMSVTEGTGSGLYFPNLKVATKTGTAEVGVLKKYVNSWVAGFFPYDDPKYAFTVVMEKGPVENTVGGVYVMRQVLDWMTENTPDDLR